MGVVEAYLFNAEEILKKLFSNRLLSPRSQGLSLIKLLSTLDLREQVEATRVIAYSSR
jgi:hypothetical protein